MSDTVNPVGATLELFSDGADFVKSLGLRAGFLDVDNAISFGRKGVLSIGVLRQQSACLLDVQEGPVPDLALDVGRDAPAVGFALRDKISEHLVKLGRVPQLANQQPTFLAPRDAYRRFSLQESGGFLSVGRTLKEDGSFSDPFVVFGALPATFPNGFTRCAATIWDYSGSGFTFAPGNFPGPSAGDECFPFMFSLSPGLRDKNIPAAANVRAPAWYLAKNMVVSLGEGGKPFATAIAPATTVPESRNANLSAHATELAPLWLPASTVPTELPPTTTGVWHISSANTVQQSTDTVVCLPICFPLPRPLVLPTGILCPASIGWSAFRQRLREMFTVPGLDRAFDHPLLEEWFEAVRRAPEVFTINFYSRAWIDDSVRPTAKSWASPMAQDLWAAMERRLAHLCHFDFLLASLQSTNGTKVKNLLKYLSNATQNMARDSYLGPCSSLLMHDVFFLRPPPDNYVKSNELGPWIIPDSVAPSARQYLRFPVAIMAKDPAPPIESEEEAQEMLLANDIAPSPDSALATHRLTLWSQQCSTSLGGGDSAKKSSEPGINGAAEHGGSVLQSLSVSTQPSHQSGTLVQQQAQSTSITTAGNLFHTPITGTGGSSDYAGAKAHSSLSNNLQSSSDPFEDFRSLSSEQCRQYDLVAPGVAVPGRSFPGSQPHQQHTAFDRPEGTQRQRISLDGKYRAISSKTNAQGTPAPSPQPTTAPSYAAFSHFGLDSAMSSVSRHFPDPTHWELLDSNGQVCTNVSAPDSFKWFAATLFHHDESFHGGLLVSSESESYVDLLTTDERLFPATLSLTFCRNVLAERNHTQAAKWIRSKLDDSLFDPVGQGFIQQCHQPVIPPPHDWFKRFPLPALEQFAQGRIQCGRSICNDTAPQPQFFSIWATLVCLPNYGSSLDNPITFPPGGIKFEDALTLLKGLLWFLSLPIQDVHLPGISPDTRAQHTPLLLTLSDCINNLLRHDGNASSFRAAWDKCPPHSNYSCCFNLFSDCDRLLGMFYSHFARIESADHPPIFRRVTPLDEQEVPGSPLVGVRPFFLKGCSPYAFASQSHSVGLLGNEAPNLFLPALREWPPSPR